MVPRAQVRVWHGRLCVSSCMMLVLFISTPASCGISSAIQRVLRETTAYSAARHGWTCSSALSAAIVHTQGSNGRHEFPSHRHRAGDISDIFVRGGGSGSTLTAASRAAPAHSALLDRELGITDPQREPEERCETFIHARAHLSSWRGRVCCIPEPSNNPASLGLRPT